MKKLTALLFIVAAFGISACGNSDAVSESADAGVVNEVTINASGEDEIEVNLDDALNDDEDNALSALEDGTYEAEFTTDSTMFHVNEVCDGKGTLTVENGVMTIHLIMPSQNVVNLFLGTADDAQSEGAELIEATVEEVTYSDGTTEEVNAFDVTVPVIGEEFDLALLGTKGTWYDHKVSVSNPVLIEE